MKQNGIRGGLLEWVENYLTDRKQLVTIKSTESGIKPINAGVPQGSVLGPLLFLVYVNDITENLLSITRLFADDSSLSFTTQNADDLEGIINHDLLTISAWAKQWLVTFNPNKTDAMILTLRPLVQPLHLNFDGTEISFVENHKHLGLTLSNNGQWHTRCKQYNIFIIKNLRNHAKIKIPFKQEFFEPNIYLLYATNSRICVSSMGWLL